MKVDLDEILKTLKVIEALKEIAPQLDTILVMVDGLGEGKTKKTMRPALWLDKLPADAIPIKGHDGYFWSDSENGVVSMNKWRKPRLLRRDSKGWEKVGDAWYPPGEVRASVHNKRKPDRDADAFDEEDF